MNSRILWSAVRKHLRCRQGQCAVTRSSGAKSRFYATERPWSTPLAKTLSEAIKTTGPVSVASYMRQCLTSDLGGYYTPTETLDRDPFGRKGDFITSPEISQIFGELIGLWVVAEWMAQGRVSHGVCLMELGPGRGTLMDDVLRSVRNFPEFAKAIDTVYLIEASTSLRQAQHKLLCGDNDLQETDAGHESRSRHLENVKIQWREDIRMLPRDGAETPFIIAHEFFDALPIHVFRSAAPAPASEVDETIQTPTGAIQAPRRSRESKTHQWREMMVAPVNKQADPKQIDDFQLVMAKASTPHSLYLPEQSPRYRALKAVTDAVIEVSPESHSYASDMAIRIGGGGAQEPQTTGGSATREPRRQAMTNSSVQKAQPSGAALIIDYGSPDTIPSNSLRGIKQHARVSPFTEPGRVDVSADVDFLALAEAALNASQGVEVHGPVDQARFLEAMGIQERATQLVKKAMSSGRGDSDSSSKQDLTQLAKRIESGWKRLVDRSPQGMGRLYQVMAIVPHIPAKSATGQVRRPVGFGGDIQT